MPSYVHDALIELVRSNSRSAAKLLRALNVQVPEFDEVRAESTDLGNVRPAEYRADLVLFLVRGSDKVLGIVVEVQLKRDERKSYSWPAYVANLRARHSCPVCLLVITVKETVARWAAKPIRLGPGSYCMPWVVGPANTPAVTDLREAEENVELAVLSAIAHGRGENTELAVRVARTATRALGAVDAERGKMYIDLLLKLLPDRLPGLREAIMNSFGYEYQSDFARRYVAEGRAQGRAEGKAEGRAEIVLKLLVSRFGALTDDMEARVRSATEKELDSVAEKLLVAQTLDEALSPLTGGAVS